MMVELFWIKSLLNFLIVCISGLILFILFNQKGKTEIRMWAAPIAIVLLHHLLGFMRFTPWINSLSSIIDTIHSFGFALNFLLGPVLLMGVGHRFPKLITLLHFVPALLGIFILSSNTGYEPSLLIASQVHFMGYAIWLLASVSPRMMNTLKPVLGLWIGSYMLHLLELMLWAQFGIISETWAWVLFCLSEALLGFSLLYLTFSLASKKARLKTSQQSGLPREILNHLEVEFSSYITKPDVYTDPLISQKKVAKALQVSPHHISRFLSNHYGDTFLNIINTQRINASKKILENTDDGGMTIQEVYYQVGFNSKSTFNTAFKKSTGMTPTAYRKHCKLLLTE
ncbi:helix-turn-helix domain-containing protein [Flagellimonas myxillae]|uniref:helix-turn-helix domain-containing protein n=1 Tax=Flagellimonas myxillae TaxID=2942214 RepID=UPI00201EBF88|nr:helix-turn-helix transcriptional regulator [Muricauda myxillae]MCL6265986.1 helix-turn-helix transcriptional regulator [Muricauda myxillae]